MPASAVLRAVQRACLLALLVPLPGLASYAIYVGRDLTADGSVLVGGTGEEPSSHWLARVPRRTHSPGTELTVGATERARFPARLTTIPQALETHAYLTMDYTSFAGFPGPLTNGGLNEHQVAVRDVWSPSRDELRAMTPPDQTGPQYSDLARIALERARTAREAVEIVGALVDEYGYVTYGGNSHLFADPEEGWLMIEYAGGRGLWIAERLGPDEIRASYPGYVQEVPLDFRERDDWLGSANFVDFAVEQGWYDPASGEPFDADVVYGLGGTMRDPGLNYVSPGQIERELTAQVPVTVPELMALVRDPRIADDQAGYGQVAHLRPDLPHPELGLLWVAPTSSVTAPFLPWWIGVTAIPPEFRQHRYLTENAGPTFLDADFQLQEATVFAGRIFRQLLYYACAFPEEQLARVQGTLTAFEDATRASLPAIERAAALALDAGESAVARTLLTEYAHARAAEALRAGRALVDGIGTEVRLRHGIPEPPAGEHINGGGVSVNCLVDIDPDRVGG
ncbi:MAG: C69 family dipeptidase [Pseudomonadales bacterium]|nr:C69 family dipeptidase [Pseudomonadales bacterium]